MEKKKYTKPTVIKADLNHEQAVLGACSASSVSIEDSTMNYCVVSGCKQWDGHGSMNDDSTGSS
jgi:hypothetical protein